MLVVTTFIDRDSGFVQEGNVTVKYTKIPIWLKWLWTGGWTNALYGANEYVCRNDKIERVDGESIRAYCKNEHF